MLPSPGTSATQAEDPRVTVDPAGDAVVAWLRGDAVFVSAFDQAGPALLGLSIPASGVAGSPSTFRVSPRDTWSSVASTRWDFGDGITAEGAAASHSYREPGRYQVSVTSLDTLGNANSATGEIAVSPAPPPTATTGSPHSVTRTSAVISATVNQHGQPTQAHFEWGRAGGPRTSTPLAAIPTDDSDHRLPYTLKGLKAGTSYRYRIAATYCGGCAAGTSIGADGAFTTLPPPRVGATLTWDAKWYARYTRFTAMPVKGVPRAGRAELRCAGARCSIRCLPPGARRPSSC